MQRRAYGSMPSWMSTHQNLALNPEQAFLKLDPHDQEMLVLTYLLVSDGTVKVYQFHVEGIERVLSRLESLYDKQENLEHGLWALVFTAGAGIISMAFFVKSAKDQCQHLVQNLISNSGAIAAAFFSAGKHSINSMILGKGEQFEANPDWWEKRAEKKKKDEEKPGMFKYPSPFFWRKDKLKPDEKVKSDEKVRPDDKVKPDEKVKSDKKVKPENVRPDDKVKPDEKVKSDAKVKPEKVRPDDKVKPDEKVKSDEKVKPEKVRPDDKVKPDEKVKSDAKVKPDEKGKPDN